MKIKIKEIELQKQIVEWLNLNGFYVWRANVGSFPYQHNGKNYYFKAGFKGMADILGITPTGRFLAIEVKAGKNKLSEYQEEFLQKINNKQGIAFVAYDLDDVIARLGDI